MRGNYYESQYEEAVVAILKGAGWEYTRGDDLHNRRITEPLLTEDLTAYLHIRYEERGLTGNDIAQIIANISNVSGGSDYERLRRAVNLYREGYNYTPQYSGAKPLHVEYIDYEHPEKNTFRVVNQFEMRQGKQTRRPDVLLFINGIPVCIFELKNPTKEGATIRDAHTQITVRYRRDIPALLKYCALACISDGSNTRLGSTVTPYEYFYAWKKVENKDDPAKAANQLKTLIRGALTPVRILEILRDFVYFPDASPGEDARETEIVCRYPQFFAAKKLQAHILKHLRRGGGDGKGGTYFGATGCGKTYTMLFLSRLLAMRSKEKLGNPTILLIVDRDDLENQAEKLFTKSTEYLGSASVRAIKSREDLATELRTNRGGGFYITTIQKFPESMGLLSERDDIICLSDEAHRTQINLGSKLAFTAKGAGTAKSTGGHREKLGAFITHGFAKSLRNALPNATYVGFTGTPIDETIHVFGEVVDRYTMLQSQRDEITVPIKYDPRMIRVFLNKEQTDRIEEYYRQCESAGARPEDVDASKKAMSSMNVLLENEEVLSRLAADIVRDYECRCDTQPNCLLKAMVTCSERKIAYKLYRKIEELRPEWCRPVKALNEEELDAASLRKLHPIPFVNVVATSDANDSKELYELLGDDAHRKMLDREFKNEASNFRIAIVVDMWITGFDAPPLTLLYNFKPLQNHTLIQTISRVNRVYKGKEYGIVVDYIGIREKLLEALKKYGGDGGTVGEELDAALRTLRQELDALRNLLRSVDFNRFFHGDGLERLSFLQSTAELILANSVKIPGKISFEAEFRGHVRRLRSAYSICHPAGLLSEDDEKWCLCFMGICAFLGKISDSPMDVVTMNREVEQMLRDAIRCGGVENVMEFDGPEVNIFEDKFLRELEQVKQPCTKFQLLVKLLSRAIREYSKTNLVRAEHFESLLTRTVEQYNTRANVKFPKKVDSDAAEAEWLFSLTEKLQDLLREINRDKSEFRKLGISYEEKAYYDILTDVREKHSLAFTDEACIDLARRIHALVAQISVHVDWLNNDRLKNQLSSDLLKLLYHVGFLPPNAANIDEEIFAKVLEQAENIRKSHVWYADAVPSDQFAAEP